VKVEAKTTSATSAIGIDLGLKTAATTSSGEALEGRRFRELEEKLGRAQRAKKKQLVRSIHAKIKNRRRDEQHKFSTAVVRANAAVFVGNVNSTAMSKTNMAKSVYDAVWYSLKVMLEYKCKHAGVIYELVNEAYTTQTCSSCGVISDASPKGRAGLRIREWTCSSCGTTHDRDINAAKNILAAGHCRLAGGIPVL
jgi:IS605 OrfB family transposase